MILKVINKKNNNQHIWMKMEILKYWVKHLKKIGMKDLDKFFDKMVEDEKRIEEQEKKKIMKKKKNLYKIKNQIKK